MHVYLKVLHFLKRGALCDVHYKEVPTHQELVASEVRRRIEEEEEDPGAAQDADGSTCS